MAAVVSPAQLTGLYKEAYADGIEGLIPDVAQLIKRIKFGEAERLGNKYHQPVVLGREHGITYAKPDAGAYALAPSVAMLMKDATLQGSQTTLRSQIALDTVARSIGSAKAFKKATLPIIESNLESHTTRLEHALLYGQSQDGIAQTSGANTTGTSTTTSINLAAGHWAVGIWAGSEGAKVVLYKDTDNALVSSAADAVFTVTTVDTDLRRIKLTGTSTGVTALNSAASAGSLNVMWYGVTGLTSGDGGTDPLTTWAATDASDMAGVDAIVTNTGSMFGIDAAVYSLWKGNTYAVGSAQLTMGKVFAGVNKAVGKGGLKEMVEVFCSIDTFSNLNTDLAALRKFDSSYSKGEAVNGFETIKYVGTNGMIEIVPHTCIKAGEAFALPLKRFTRVGATEVTFNTPGRQDEIFLNLPNNNGFELRSYADQALLCRTPAKTIKFTGIVNL